PPSSPTSSSTSGSGASSPTDRDRAGDQRSHRELLCPPHAPGRAPGSCSARPARITLDTEKHATKGPLMNSTEQNLSWVVYAMTLPNRPDGMRAVCEQSEW